MQGFSNSFLVFLYQIAFGGLVALAGTPFHEIERAFYKSTAGVLYVIALLGLWGESSLFMRGILQGSAWGNRLEIIFHVIFVLAFSCYMASLWTELPVFRARSFAASILTGLVGLMLSAQRFYDAPSAECGSDRHGEFPAVVQSHGERGGTQAGFHGLADLDGHRF